MRSLKLLFYDNLRKNKTQASMALSPKDFKKSASNQKIRPHSHKESKQNSKIDEYFRKNRSSTFMTQDGVPPITPLSGRSLISLGRSFSTTRDFSSDFSNARLLFSTSKISRRTDHSVDAACFTKRQVYGDTSEV